MPNSPADTRTAPSTARLPWPVSGIGIPLPASHGDAYQRLFCTDAIAEHVVSADGQDHPIDADAPAAYCLPCGRHRVVITTSALSRLSPGQLRAVLAHERAHLRGHHHLMLAAAAALARAFPAIPLLARASAELAVLAEMTADDHDPRRHGAADLAAALVTLAGAGSRSTALAAAVPPPLPASSGCSRRPRSQGSRPGPHGWPQAPRHSSSQPRSPASR
jgi:hypothetical protein